MPSAISVIQGSLDNFIASGGMNSSGGVGGPSSLLGEPARPLGCGNDSDHLNGPNNGGSSRRGCGATETNDDLDDKRDTCTPENDIDADDSGEFQVFNKSSFLQSTI